MLQQSPLRAQHEEYAARRAASLSSKAPPGARPGAGVGQQLEMQIEWLPYGPGASADHSEVKGHELVATYGNVEPEYAAFRRGAGLMDGNHRGTIVVTGKDRIDFLNRMLTQELKDFGPGDSRPAFLVNRKGRIEADLLLVADNRERILIDVDIHQAELAVKTLSEFVFSEDVVVVNASAAQHRLSLHGRLALDALATECGELVRRLDDRNSCETAIADVPIVVARRDQTGEPGLELFVPIDQLNMVWERLLCAPGELKKLAGHTRPIGWYAYNIARIEGGTPLFNIDFGPTNLPHESSVLDDRVCFTKGCYPGQEIVARMHNLGKPKQMLVGLTMQGDLLPVAGSQVFARLQDGSMGEQIGIITSSTLSPMLSAACIGFAMIKTAFAGPETNVLVNAEGEQAVAAVGPLRFWKENRQEAGSTAGAIDVR